MAGQLSVQIHLLSWLSLYSSLTIQNQLGSRACFLRILCLSPYLESAVTLIATPPHTHSYTLVHPHIFYLSVLSQGKCSSPWKSSPGSFSTYRCSFFITVLCVCTTTYITPHLVVLTLLSLFPICSLYFLKRGTT